MYYDCAYIYFLMCMSQVQGNQKVSVHLMITIHKVDAQRLFITLYMAIWYAQQSGGSSNQGNVHDAV